MLFLQKRLRAPLGCGSDTCKKHVLLGAAGLDIAVHYLDDSFLGGDIEAVGPAFRTVETKAAALGLCLNLSKCELIAVGSADITALHCHFPDALLRDEAGTCRAGRHFEFLGAAVGDSGFVRNHTADRAAKAGDLLDALGELEDPQVALRLLRASAGFARMLHSMRCSPTAAQTVALDMFDGMVKCSFSDFTGLQLTALQWKQAALGLAHGDLDLRSTSDHAAAAFLTSWASTLDAARELDASFSLPEARAGADVLAAFTSFNA